MMMIDASIRDTYDDGIMKLHDGYMRVGQCCSN